MDQTNRKYPTKFHMGCLPLLSSTANNPYILSLYANCHVLPSFPGA